MNNVLNGVYKRSLDTDNRELVNRFLPDETMFSITFLNAVRRFEAQNRKFENY